MSNQHTPDTHVSDLIEWTELPKKLLISKTAMVVGRCFLNTATAEHTGSMKYEISVQKRRLPKSHKHTGFYYSINGSVEVRDCARRIDLSLDGNTKNAAGLQKLENTERKLRKIIHLCEKALEAIAHVRAQGFK